MAKGVAVIIDELREEFLEGAKTGGHSHEFQQHCVSDFKAHPEKYAKQIEGMVAEIAARRWQVDPPPPDPGQGELFEVDGEPIPRVITFVRPGEGGGYRKILDKHATIEQLREHAITAMRMGAMASAGGERIMRQADKLELLAKGDRSAFIRDVADNGGNGDGPPLIGGAS